MAENPSKPESVTTPISRPLDYARARSFGDLVRDWLPSRDRALGVLKNLFVVVPLTLLIWVYAEREQAVTQPVVFGVDARTTAPDRVVVLRWPVDHNVVVELSGPRAKIDLVRQKLQDRGGPDGGNMQLLIDPQLGTGPQELPAVGELNKLDLFKRNGITVKTCQPAYIKVDIDQLEERDAIIKVPPAIARNLENVTFVPRTVKIRAPKRLLDAAESEGKELAVWADLSKREELKTRTGNVELKNVPLAWDHRENVTLSSPVADATVIIRASDVQFTIPSVTIFKETPAGLEEKYDVTYTASIPNVGVTGPAEQIQAIKAGTFTVKARFPISTLNNKVGVNKTRLQFDLPPGVTLAPETVERANSWEFTMTERGR